MRIPLLPLSLLIIFGSSQNLERVVDDFSSLLRITNAIALQNSAIQRTLDFRQVIAELINVEPDVFRSLMAANVSGLIGSVTEVFVKIRMLPDTQIKTEKINIFKDAMHFFQTYFGETQNFANVGSMDDFHTNVKGNLANSFPEPCNDKRIFETIDVLDSMFNKDRTYNNYTQRVYLTSFKNLSTSIADCMADFSTYMEKIGNDSLVQSIAPLATLLKLGEAFGEWNQLIPSIAQVSEIINSSSAAFRATTDLKKSQKIAHLILNITASHQKFDDRDLRKVSGRLTKTVTRGFPEGTADLLRVPADLKSLWFRRDIAQGKSTRELHQALRTFGEAVQEFDKVNSLLKGFFDLRYEEVKATMGLLVDVEDFYSMTIDQNAYMGYVNSFETCVSSHQPVATDEKHLQDFEIAIQKPLMASNLIDEIIIASDLVSREVMTIRNTFETIAKAIPNVHPERNDLRAMPGFSKFSQEIASLATLGRAVRQFKTDVTALFYDADFKAESMRLANVVTNSNILPFIRCLKTANFLPAPPLETAEFLGSVRALKRNTEGQEYTKKYLQNAKVFQDTVIHIESVVTQMTIDGSKWEVPKAIQKFNDSTSIVGNLAVGVDILDNMAQALAGRMIIEDTLRYPKSVMNKVKSRLTQRNDFWTNSTQIIGKMMSQLSELDKLTASATTMKDMLKVIQEAEKVEGVRNFDSIFNALAESLKRISVTDPDHDDYDDYQMVIDNSEEMTRFDLDFVSHKKSLDTAHTSFGALDRYFEDIFEIHARSTDIETGLSLYGLIGLCCGSFVLCVLVAFLVYGFTENERSKYRNLYLYYFPNKKEFERRWRYSLFMDRENGQNALVNASRDVNHINVKYLLDKGAYVNVYSVTGNTPLHIASKLGLPKVVELLIRSGADRTMLNGQNRTPEQMIPANFKERMKEDVRRYEQVEDIYYKYRNSKFRLRVPQVFATHLFHIYVERRTNDELTSAFTQKYQGITSEEPNLTSTHCVCQVTKDGGALETDDIDILSWIFYGVIMVRESWMADCLEDEKAIRQDFNYLVEDVKYKGVLYEDCILPWSRAQSKGEMPFLLGAHVVFVMKECPKLPSFKSLIIALGGVFLEKFPVKENYNIGSHPYLHTNVGPLFIIHDGQIDLSFYKNDPDHMYTLFTDEEFVGFLLRREIQQETNMNPISQVSTVNDSEQ